MRLFLSLLAGSVLAYGSWKLLEGVPLNRAEEHVPFTVALGFLTGALMSVFVSPRPQEAGRGHPGALAVTIVLTIVVNLMWVVGVVGFLPRSETSIAMDFVCLLPIAVLTGLLAGAWRLTPLRLLGWAAFLLASQGFLTRLIGMKDWMTPLRVLAAGGLLVLLLVVRGVTRKAR